MVELVSVATSTPFIYKLISFNLYFKAILLYAVTSVIVWNDKKFGNVLPLFIEHKI